MTQDQIKQLAEILVPLGEAYNLDWQVAADKDDIEAIDVNDDYAERFRLVTESFCEKEGLSIQKQWIDQIAEEAFVETEGYDAPGRGWSAAIVEAAISDVLKRMSRRQL